MADAKRHIFGLQFKVLATLAILFTAFAIAALAWGASIVQNGSLRDAEERAVALSDQMDAVWDYVDENQPATNIYVQELGEQARGLVCVSAVKAIARDFSRENESVIHVVALNPRNKDDSPDPFELEALEAFNADRGLAAYSGIAADENGEETYYYLRPRRINASCLTCHGSPAGEKDPLGYDKEGYEVGMVAGAVSVREPLASYTANTEHGVQQGIVMFLLGLLAVMGVMYAVLRATVIRPVARVSAAAAAYKPGRESQRIGQTSGTDEIAELARDFNAMADDLDSLYANLEDRVEERTVELERVNTELQGKQAELECAFGQLKGEAESKEQLFASLSHDLRTPLASIIAYTQLAETQMGADPDRGAEVERDREVIERIGEQARTLVGMVDNILAFARADAHGIEPHPTAVDLLDMAAHLRATAQPIAERHGIALAVHADADLPLIEADRDLTLRVLQNLVTNAMKFTPKGGRVEARIGFEASDDAARATGSKSAGYVEFAVEDTGVGIATDDLERIFEPYTKGAYREGGNHAGAGLGLAVIRQIADVMQGTVWAEQREGGGSRFTFRFPAPVLDEEDYE